METEEAVRSLSNELNAARNYLSEFGDAEETRDYISEALVIAEQELARFGERLSAGETMHVQPIAQEGAERRRELLEKAVEALDSALSRTKEAGIQDEPLGQMVQSARESAGRIREGS